MNSSRSSSDQASDQSILLCGFIAPNRSAKAVNSAAAPGGRRRNACTSEASCALSGDSIDSSSVYDRNDACLRRANNVAFNF